MTRVLTLTILVLMLIPLVAAAGSFTYQKDKPADIKVSCFDLNNSLCSSTTACYITVHSPNVTNLVSNGSMTYKNDFYNYTVSQTTETGVYSVITRCEGTSNAFSTFTIDVTPTGLTQTSILENPVLLIFGIFAILLIGMGAYFSNAWFGFIGAIMFLLGGVYTMIYGFNNVLDLYTRGVGITFLGLGFVFMFTAAYEWVWGADD